MTSDEIRETFLEFFEQRDHRRLPSASLIPATEDTSTLFTIAGMQPLKRYFSGEDTPPHPRLTSCQKTFRTVDIDIIGTTSRHLTFFEMLGNFSMGDYFKQGAVELAWTLSRDGFGFDAEQIWITVFAGDEELGLEADEEAIDAWLSLGVPRERIVGCPRSENFWQVGPTGPCGPCSELYLDRGLEYGAADDLPGGENERFIEYWNLVFMQYDQDPPNTLTPLPAQNIDTGLGLNRMALIQQGVESVFDTDQFAPLMALGEELSGRRMGEDERTDRALRVLADHARGMTFLVADGVVPSNEERGYLLRRIMRRAIQRGRSLGMAPGFLLRYAEVVRETMGRSYPELPERRDAIGSWLGGEEENFGHTLAQGLKLLEDLMGRAQEEGAEGIAAADAFRLHDTFGFPLDLTLELAAEQDLGVDEEGFEGLMDVQRERARAAVRGGGRDEARVRAEALARTAGFRTEFTGYAETERETAVGLVEPDGGRVLVKLLESPFYAAGGGQVSDAGWVECAEGDCRARVEDVLRLGDDQLLAVVPERGELTRGERVRARVDGAARHATEANHTATHLLHAALRARLGGHVRQAGSYVGPDKLRFDFTHGAALSPEEIQSVEDGVNDAIKRNDPVRALTTTLDEARRLGAMALFGEKYSDVVRMVEVGAGGMSRELCGGTHVGRTGEIGLFKLTSESSSAANVRRIEALTGPAAIDLLRTHDHALEHAARVLRTTPDRVGELVEQREAERREAKKAAKQLARTTGASAEPEGDGAVGAGFFGVDVLALAGRAEERDGAKVLAEAVEMPGMDELLTLTDHVKGRLGDAAIVLAAAAEGHVYLVASVAPALVARGVRAGEVVKVAAQVTGGGGGGRDTMARAGGRDPEKLPEALAAARAAIDAALDA